MSKNRMAALTGAAFFVVTIISFGFSGDTPGTDDSIEDIVDFYKDQSDTSVGIAIAAGILACVLLVIYGSYLRKLFESVSGRGSVLATAAFGGAVILAAGIAFDTTVVVALNDTIDDADPITIQTLNAFYNNDYIPMAVGAATIGLAGGLTVVRNGGLPVWMGYAALLFALVMVTPIGFAGFIGMGLWILVSSIILGIRDEEPRAA